MIPASSVQTSTHWSNSTSCVSEKQNPGTARQHPVHTSKRPRHDTHTASVVFIESVDAQSFIVIVSKSHPVDPQTPQLVDLGSKLSRTAQWPACKTLPWMKTRGKKKQKKDLCSRAEPSRAAERRKRFRAVCLLLCSFLWGVVLIRRLRTNCTRSDDPVLQHESVKDDVNRSRFYVTFSPPARHISNTVWCKNTARNLRRLLLLWPSGSAGSAQDSEPWRHHSAGLFCSLWI